MDYVRVDFLNGHENKNIGNFFAVFFSADKMNGLSIRNDFHLILK